MKASKKCPLQDTLQRYIKIKASHIQVHTVNFDNEHTPAFV